MKICIVSLFNNAASRLETHDGLPDLTHYIPQYRHEFVYRQFTKHNAKSEIDKLCGENFDAFMNYMGVDVDGIEATKHLESKNVTILTNPSSLLATSKLDVRDDAIEPAFKTPRNTYGKYPKIVKYFDKSGSLGLDRNFVCYDEQAVRERIALLQEQDPTCGILVQDYIFGDECAAVVIDLGGHVIALSPVKFVFPASTLEDVEFLTQDDKNGSVAAREINHVIIEGELRERLQRSAVNAFKNIKASCEGAFAHVTMRLERNTGNIYVIGIDCNPFIFNRKGYRFDGDFMLEATFPGKQEAFLDTILTIKRSQLGYNKSRIRHTAAVYDSWSDTYDEFWETTDVSKIQQFTVANFDFTGSVLDLACGTGIFGRILHAHGAKTTEIVGVEISAGMLCAANIKKYYKKPLWNCSMQEYVMVIDAQVIFPSRSLLMVETAPQENFEFDHVVCFGALLFLDAVELNTVLARVFMMACKSLTMEVDNLDSNVIETMQKGVGDHCFVENHVQMVERFGVPNGWKLVYKQDGSLFPSPTSQGNVEGYIVRFEKLNSS